MHFFNAGYHFEDGVGFVTFPSGYFCLNLSTTSGSTKCTPSSWFPIVTLKTNWVKSAFFKDIYQSGNFGQK